MIPNGGARPGTVSITGAPWRRGVLGHGLASAWAFSRRKPMGAIGSALIIGLVLVAALASVVAPHDPLDTFQQHQLEAPSPAFPFGTDQLGRDMLSRILHGARISLYVGVGSVLLGTGLATAVGLVGGYFGGILDSVAQRVVDALMAFPWVVLMLTMMAIFGAGLTNLMIALAIAMAPRNSRVVRSAVLSIREAQFVEAAKAIGCSHTRIMLVHILPNIMAPVIVLITIYVGWAILLESSLSFLGLGVPPPYASWGRDLSDAGRRFLIAAPWIGIFPGIAISAAVFGFNMMGDALRDVLDPRLRGT